MKRLTAVRMAVQAVFFAIFISSFLAAMNYSKGLVAPGVLFRFDPLIIIASTLSGLLTTPGVIVSASMLALTFVFGRFFCGWMCPLGAMIDAAAFAARRKNDARVPFAALARSVKYAVLAALAYVALSGGNRMLAADPLVMMSNLVTMNLALPNIILLSASVIPSVFIRRSWCRFFCPLGALYSIPASMALFRRKIGNKCAKGCEACSKTCRMGAIRKDAGYIKSECVLCMDCVYACPEHATKFRF